MLIIAPMIEYNKQDTKSVLQAKFDAQKIAFAPIVFQASKTLCDLGILQLISEQGKDGITVKDICDKLDLPRYGVQVLLEVALSSELVRFENDKFYILKTGRFLVNDTMTQVNMNFVHDVCYQGMFSLKEAIITGKPTGLKVFDNWNTIYEGLSQLPEQVKKSWFEFDHFYSDGVFDELLPIVFKNNPQTIMDVGANTGKWSLKCLDFNSDVKMKMVDLPGQLNVATQNLNSKGFEGRYEAHPTDLLNDSNQLPEGANVIWMSQFLDCFSEEQIISILKRAKDVMSPESSLFILETYWDRQEYEAAAFSLHNTSLYFTCLANGCSKMYHSDEMKRCISEAGLQVVMEKDSIGVSHSLFECKLV